MKRLILLSFVLLTTMVSRADAWVMPADFRVVCKDGSVAFFRGHDTELTFSDDATLLYITTKDVDDRDEALVSYAVEGIEAIEFCEPAASGSQYSYGATHIDVTLDPTDDTSYTEADEEVITDELHEDYGDFIENYAPTNRVTVTYDGTTATVSGTVSGVNARVTGAHVLITSSKKNIAYTLRGKATDGSFKLYSTNKTQITLDGTHITNPTGAAINIQSGKTMLIELADGTENTLVDGTSYTMSMGEDQKGTLFSEGQLVFSGKGALSVKSNYGHGIVSDDYIRVRGGNITVSSVKDGINTNDRFIMYGGTVTVEALQDGLDTGKGYIEMGGGRLTVNAVDEGVTASYEGDDAGNIDPLITPYIDIRGGLIKITTTGDKGHALRAMSTLRMTGGIVQATSKGAGAKAIMSEGAMTLTGGKLTAIAEGDALYEADIEDLSSSAALRSKGTLTIGNMVVDAKSSGAGGKVINNVGDIAISNSTITAVASGDYYEYNALDSRARAITTDGKFSMVGGVLKVKANDDPLHVKGTKTFSNKAVYEGYQLK